MQGSLAPPTALFNKLQGCEATIFVIGESLLPLLPLRGSHKNIKIINNLLSNFYLCLPYPPCFARARSEGGSARPCCNLNPFILTILFTLQSYFLYTVPSTCTTVVYLHSVMIIRCGCGAGALLIIYKK